MDSKAFPPPPDPVEWRSIESEMSGEIRMRSADSGNPIPMIDITSQPRSQGICLVKEVIPKKIQWKYYVNKNPDKDGNNEVHSEDCWLCPSSENREFLGGFSHCFRAVVVAKLDYPNADGCAHCSPDCHST